MGSLYISGAAFLLMCRWANKATRRSIPFAAASRRCRAGSASFGCARGMARAWRRRWSTVAEPLSNAAAERCCAPGRQSRPCLGDGCQPPAPAGRRYSYRSRTGAPSSARGIRTAAGRSARRSRRTWTRSTQKPVSALWKVTRSTMPTSISPAPCRTTPSMAVVKVSKLRLQQIRGVLHVSDHCRHASDGPGSALKAPSISSFSNRGAVPAGKINVLLVC
jgi:hypothetical protein